MTINQTKNVICQCSGTTEEQMKALISNGINDLEAISRVTGVCSGCGACDVEVGYFLAENS